MTQFIDCKEESEAIFFRPMVKIKGVFREIDCVGSQSAAFAVGSTHMDLLDFIVHEVEEGFTSLMERHGVENPTSAKLETYILEPGIAIKPTIPKVLPSYSMSLSVENYVVYLLPFAASRRRDVFDSLMVKICRQFDLNRKDIEGLGAVYRAHPTAKIISSIPERRSLQ